MALFLSLRIYTWTRVTFSFGFDDGKPLQPTHS
jgi:hypothetical protein